MTVRFDFSGERYDDRFVCRWHPKFEDGVPVSMGWCGLDCPHERYRLALAMERDLQPLYRPHPVWDAIAGGAA